MMNISKVLSVIATITELIVPGHPTCKIAGQLANDTDTLPIVTLRLKDLQSVEESGGDPYEYLKYKKIHQAHQIALGSIAIRSPYPDDAVLNMTMGHINEQYYLKV